MPGMANCSHPPSIIHVITMHSQTVADEEDDELEIEGAEVGSAKKGAEGEEEEEEQGAGTGYWDEEDEYAQAIAGESQKCWVPRYRDSG